MLDALADEIEPAEDRVVILGVGSDIRGDDAAGVETVSRLEGSVPPTVDLVDGGVLPENYTATIRRADPDHVIIVDAVAFDGEPGTVEAVDPERLRDYSMSAHDSPVSLFTRYVRRETGADVHLVGIRPTHTDRRDGMTEPVADAVDDVVAWVEETFPGAADRRPSSSV